MLLNFTSATVILEAPAMSLLKFFEVLLIIRFPAVSAFQALIIEKSPLMASSMMNSLPLNTLFF